MPGVDADKSVSIGPVATTLIAAGLVRTDTHSNIVTIQPLGGALSVSLAGKPDPTAAAGFLIAQDTIAQLTWDEAALAKFISASGTSTFPVWTSLGRHRDMATVT
jgi:hypothetical protein